MIDNKPIEAAISDEPSGGARRVGSGSERSAFSLNAGNGKSLGIKPADEVAGNMRADKLDLVSGLA